MADRAAAEGAGKGDRGQRGREDRPAPAEHEPAEPREHGNSYRR
jgi:hypothetical protein